MHFNFAYSVTISLHPLCGWKKVGEKRWVKTGGWKCVGENVWVKIAGWKRTGGFEGVNCFDNICGFPRIIHRNVAILNWFKWFYWTAPRKSLSWWLSYRSPSELIYDTFLHICIRVRVCERRESVCACSTLRNSAEICVAMRKLAKTGDLGRQACGGFGCYCVFDAFYPLTLLAAAHPFFMLITCVCVCGCPYVSACL